MNFETYLKKNVDSEFKIFWENIFLEISFQSNLVRKN